MCPRSCLVLQLLLVFCGAQYFGEGLDVINATMSGESGQCSIQSIQYIFSSGDTNHFLCSSVLQAYHAIQNRLRIHEKLCARAREYLRGSLLEWSGKVLSSHKTQKTIRSDSVDLCDREAPASPRLITLHRTRSASGRSAASRRERWKGATRRRSHM